MVLELLREDNVNFNVVSNMEGGRKGGKEGEVTFPPCTHTIQSHLCIHKLIFFYNNFAFITLSEEFRHSWIFIFLFVLVSVFIVFFVYFFVVVVRRGRGLFANIMPTN